MKQSITQLILAILACSSIQSAAAIEIHKWTDPNGVTHYSDALAVGKNTDTSLLELPSVVKAKSTSDYYSITNQWQRLNHQRIERERLQLERDRQQLQHSQLQSPAIPKIPQAYAQKSVKKPYRSSHRRSLKQRAHRIQKYKKFSHRYAGKHRKHQRLKTTRRPFFKHLR